MAEQDPHPDRLADGQAPGQAAGKLPGENPVFAVHAQIRRVRARLRAGIEAGRPPDLPELRALLGVEAPGQQEAVDRVLAGRGDFADLRRFSTYARFLPPARYLDAVQRHDPGLRLPPMRDAAFTGTFHAKGQGSLNAYRIVTLPEGALSGDALEGDALEGPGLRAFEKIYDATGLQYRRAALLQAEIGPALTAQGIRTAAPLLWARGARLAALYAEFLPGAHHPCPEPVFMDALAALAGFSLATAPALAEALQRRDLSWLPDYTRNNRYRRGLAVARARLDPGGAAEWAALADRIAALPRAFAHGDPSPNNVSATGAVFDFDMWGLYPPFYDIALALAARCETDRFERAQDYLDHVATILPAPRHRDEALSLLFLSVVLRSRAQDPAQGQSQDPGFPDRLLADLLAMARR